VPGVRYGLRAHGPFRPEEGHFFHPGRRLVDPYARGVTGGDPTGPLSVADRGDPTRLDPRDSGDAAPWSVVVDEPFDWRGDAPPRTPWRDTLLYEGHLKGLTRLHPGVPRELRGTYLGLACDPVLEHLRRVGVTAVELLPIHAIFDEPALRRRGLVNYWGYSTLAYFAPEPRYAATPGRELWELKETVRRLHAAGIEVILDVVYNHTCEGGPDGPTVSFRGLDNRTYYRARADQPGAYIDHSGCGNTLALEHPQVLKLVMDSLRYWVNEVHIDGFRFDLAVALGRVGGGFDVAAPFFQAIHQDPVLSQVKLIAEPWDLGQGGYQVGNFPPHWAEWNGRFRDTMRGFWRGEAHRVGDMGYRLTGSSDLFADDGRLPHHGVTFVTAHDGYTLRDLTSYEQKHNEANGENNRDGSHHEQSVNFGVEGDSTDPRVLSLRARRQRTLLASLLLSPGVPMLLAGDELGRTQRGNNNAYCQDGEISWVDWSGTRAGGAATDPPLLAFVVELTRLRRSSDAFRRPTFFRGNDPSGVPDIVWLRPDGREMRSPDWEHPALAAVALLTHGPSPQHLDSDSLFYWALNAEPEAVRFALPRAASVDRLAPSGPLQVLVDTSGELVTAELRPGGHVMVPGGSLAVFSAPSKGPVARRSRAPGKRP
jgi:isoamylase